MTPLDPRRSLVIDTRELGRRAGSMHRIATTVPAPEELGTMGCGVPEGSDLALTMRLESVIDGVLVSGTAQAHVVGECSRCLDPVTDEVSVDFAELFGYPETDSRGRPVRRDPAAQDAEEGGPELDGDLLDLEPTVRDAIVLALPLAPVCREDCPGLCPQCGLRLAEAPEHHHDQVDTRWAALAGVLDSQHDEKEEG